MSAWPNPDKPGYPLNPERDGEHVMGVTDDHGREWHEVWKWDAHRDGAALWLRPNFQGPCYGYQPIHLAAPIYSNIQYKGPFLTPADLAAAEERGFQRGFHHPADIDQAMMKAIAAARAEGAEAMREACAKHVERIPEWGGQDYYCDSCKGGAIYPDREDVARDLRALPIPAADALTKMAAPVPSHQHGGENAQQQGGEEGIAPFSPPDALARRDDWQPIETAPKDGTRVLLWCVHANAAYSRDPIEEGWACAVIGQWIDHNGGGWTWHGLCGRMTHWQPLPPPPAGARAVGETKP